MAIQSKILIVEDEINIVNLVRTILETNEYQVIDANNGSMGKLMFNSHHPDLIILDLGLPDMDGINFIKHIREKSMVPIIVLSARSNESDKVEALNLGANDYVTKPFGTNELVARVKAVLRTYQFKELKGQSLVQKVGDLSINFEKRHVLLGNQEIKLTNTEYKILELFTIHIGKVLTYSDIISKIWGYNDSGSIKKLQVNIANIRKKLGEKPGEYIYILNDLGVGYRMNDELEV